MKSVRRTCPVIYVKYFVHFLHIIMLICLIDLQIRYTSHNQRNNTGKSIQEIAARITTHYRYSLNKLFQVFPAATAAIITEEDLLAAPDFFRYDPLTYNVSEHH